MVPSDALNRLLFPAPRPTYDARSFPGEIVYSPAYHGPLSGFPSEGCLSTPRHGIDYTAGKSTPISNTNTNTNTTTVPSSSGLRRTRVGSGSWSGTSENHRSNDPVPCLFLPYDSARFVVLYLHSNAEDLGKCRLAMCTMRAQFQVHILAVEYPGYGIAKGGPCDERKATASALAAMTFLREVLHWPLDSIIVFGRSIGCGPAISVALQHEVAGLILVSPMMSFRELCKDIAGRLPAAFVQERFPNFARMPKVASPVLIVHGKKDEVIPYRHAEELFRVCRSRKLLVAPPEMTHNSDLLSEVNYLVLPMLQFFALPDYCFMDIVVPAWAYEEPDLDSIQEVEHASPDYTGRCQPPALDACKEASTWGSTLKWILDLGLRYSDRRSNYPGLANEGPEAPLARRISMPHAVSSNIFVARPSPPPEVPEEDEDEEKAETAAAAAAAAGQAGQAEPQTAPGLAPGEVPFPLSISEAPAATSSGIHRLGEGEGTEPLWTRAVTDTTPTSIPVLKPAAGMTIVADGDAGAGGGVPAETKFENGATMPTRRAALSSGGSGGGGPRSPNPSADFTPGSRQAMGKSPYSSEGTLTSYAPPEVEDGVAAPRASKEIKFSEDRSAKDRQCLISKTGLHLPGSQGRTASRNKLQEVDGNIVVPADYVSQHICVEECELLEEEEAVPEVTTRNCLGTCSQASSAARPQRMVGPDPSSTSQTSMTSSKAAAGAAATAAWAAAAAAAAAAAVATSGGDPSSSVALSPQMLRCTIGAERDQYGPLNKRDRPQLDVVSSFPQPHHTQLQPAGSGGPPLSLPLASLPLDGSELPPGHPFSQQQWQQQQQQQPERGDQIQEEKEEEHQGQSQSHCHDLEERARRRKVEPL